MRKAAEWGSDMIEFDLRMTKDGVLVLLHDATLDRTSNPQGPPANYTLAELKQGNFSHQNAPNQPPRAATYADMPIASFAGSAFGAAFRMCVGGRRRRLG